MLGAVVQALSYSVSNMVLGRSIVGIAVGAASFVTPLYIAELAPPTYRGRLITMNVLSITLGQVVAYVIGWIFAEHGDPSTGWRWMVGLGALPAALQCALILFMPETPRWLVKAGKSTEAGRIIQKTLGSDKTSYRLVDSVVKGIEREIREEQGRAELTDNGGKRRFQDWHELLAVPRNRRALIIACLLQGLQQLCGFVSNLTPATLGIPAWLTLIEFVDVFLCDDFYDARIPDTDTHITYRRCHKFCVHRACAVLNRPNWSKKNITIFDTLHGMWPFTCSIRL